MSAANIARKTARTSAAVIALLVLGLTVDYVIARVRLPKDDARIVALQKQVQENAKLAPKLAAEHDAISNARRARKTRSNVLSILLMVAAGVFLLGAKWIAASEGRVRLAARKLVQIEPPAPAAIAETDRAAAVPVPPQIDLSFVDQLVEREGRTTESAILILQAIQSHYRYLPDEALTRVCELTEITPAQIAGTSTFYSRFRRSPVGKHVVRVCHGTACHVLGARQITEELRRRLRIPEGADTDPERMFTLDEVACLGCCSLAPVLMVDEHTAGKLTPASAHAALDAVAQKEEA